MSTGSTSKRAPVPIGSLKRLRGRSSSHSSASSSFTNNENGLTQLDGRLRSVLSHRLGLPLVYAFNGRDPGKLSYLRQESDYFSNDKVNDFNEVFKDALDKWPKKENETGQENEEELEIEEKQEKETLQKKKTPLETALTKGLTATINDKKLGIPLEAKDEVPLLGGARVDIGLYQKHTGRPLMFVEVGLKGVEWWKKFDQGVRFVKKTQEDTKERPTDASPLLLAIMTVDDGRQSKKTNPRFEVKLGVFLCFWKERDEEVPDVGLVLLSHSSTHDEAEATKAFGRMLRGVCDFSSWALDQQNASDYEYFSSNCCKVGNNMVLRCYDSRFRETTRSPVIYLNDDCKDIVGAGVEHILDIPANASSRNEDSDPLWNPNPSRAQTLQVIATPFRVGKHYVTKPESFIPIIDQLDKLHKKGFVHADIRGFNTVFNEKTGQGYLIDFDFGGKTEKGRKYPNGYNFHLVDGSRWLDDIRDPSKNDVLPWHDWYALGRLIFEVFVLVIPEERQDDATLALSLLKLNTAWMNLRQDPTTEMKEELKAFLTECQNKGIRVTPNSNYTKQLEISGDEATKLGATGSPLKKKH